VIRHRLLFCVILLVWTWLLIKPNPVPLIVADNLLDDIKFIIGKTLHLTMYTVLALYGTWRMQPRLRKWIWLLLFLHAAASELAQHFGSLYYNTHRSGRLADVAIDSAGIAVAVWLRFKYPKTDRGSCHC